VSHWGIPTLHGQLRYASRARIPQRWLASGIHDPRSLWFRLSRWRRPNQSTPGAFAPQVAGAQEERMARLSGRRILGAPIGREASFKQLGDFGPGVTMVGSV